MVTDFFNFSFYFNMIWWPWISIFSETLFIQFCIVYLLFLLVNSKNIYYTLLYFFVEVFYIGFFLCYYQMELFAGFLWVVECTVVFIFLLLLFFVNFKGFLNNFEKKIYFFNKFIFVVFFFFISVIYFHDYEGNVKNELNITCMWDDFYESVYNTNMNDFTCLLISYYSINSFEFLIVGLILLIGSVLCVNLYKNNKNVRLQSYGNFFNFFNFFVDSINYNFIRKQNLTNQNRAIPSSRIFKKK